MILCSCPLCEIGNLIIKLFWTTPSMSKWCHSYCVMKHFGEFIVTRKDRYLCALRPLGKSCHQWYRPEPVKCHFDICALDVSSKHVRSVSWAEARRRVEVASFYDSSILTEVILNFCFCWHWQTFKCQANISSYRVERLKMCLVSRCKIKSAIGKEEKKITWMQDEKSILESVVNRLCLRREIY